MSCCPSAPPIKVGASGDVPTGIADNQPVRGESTECFMSTANNPTGLHDDATGNVLNKIETPTIPLDANARVNVRLRLQAGSDRVPTSWVMKDDAGNTPSWVKLFEFESESEAYTAPYFVTTSGLFGGTFKVDDFGKQLRITISAHDAQGEIDNRGYVFSPAKSTGSDSIQFVHPLPGAVVTSRFDPQRLHPVKKIIKPHNGADFALPGRKIGDVLAAADGEVIFTGFEAKGAGNYVKIKHLNGSGKHLCTTVYMHLDKIYVASGQKVSAGQKIGLEGNTGIGTGAHLHFECRLPNDTRIDPEPLIRGTLKVARETKDDNTPVEASIETRTNQSAVLTPANVDAKQAGCKPYGAEYPSPATPLGEPAPAEERPPISGDPFEKAWDLTMQTETIGWGSTPPTNQETLDGLIETKAQRRNTGYVDHPADPGGETKFGIAQKFNKNIQVRTVNYEKARDAGYTTFWKGKRPEQTASAGKPKTSIAMFNFGFLCGNGGLNTIISRANIGALSDEASVDSLCDQAKAYFLEKIAANPKKEVFKNGWLARVEKVRTYAKSAVV